MHVEKITFLNKFYTIFHLLSPCVFISIQNIGWSIPLKFRSSRSQQRCFLAKFMKFSRTAFFTEHLWWLLLKVWEISLLNKFFPATKIMSLFIYFKISQNSQENAFAGVSFFNKFADWRSPNLLNRNSSTGISFKFCEILNKSTFTEKNE